MVRASALLIEHRGQTWRIGDDAYDLSIPLDFEGLQPNFFHAPHARAIAIESGDFVGDVRRGGSCNCATYTLTPHCNGTHTECIGHVVTERVAVRDASTDHLCLALLVSAAPVDAAATCEASDPQPHAGDLLITQSLLEAAVGDQELAAFQALIVRTLPNEPTKRVHNYSAGETPPYFSVEAMRWIVQHGIQHLVVDLPSLDRADDGGRLTAHRVFWGLPAGETALAHAARPCATVTELAYIDDEIRDGAYLLNLQVAPFVADAAPSRPVLYPLTLAT